MPYLPTRRELANISAHVSAPTIRIERDPRLQRILPDLRAAEVALSKT